MGAATAERKAVAEMRAAKAEREAAEKEKASGRAEIDAAHKALGTGQDVPGSEHFDDGPQDVHGGDGMDEGGGEQLPDMPVGRTVPMGRFVVGGKKPTTSSVRLLGGKVDAPINAEKGDRLVLRVEVVVKSVNHIDEEDSKTGQIVGCERRQGMRITGVSVMDG